MNVRLEELLSSSRRRALVAEDQPANAARRRCLHGGQPLGKKSENWPSKDGVPLFPILSIATDELPFVPDFLTRAAYWAFFVATDEHEHAIADGSLVVRRYETMNALVPLLHPASPPAGIGLTFREIGDYPDQWVLDALVEDDPDLVIDGECYPCHDGIKLGGYPRLIQETALLMGLHPDYQIQLDGTDVYRYADSGIGYVYADLTATIFETM